MEIKILVADKRASVIGAPVIVCGNSDYTIKFEFDEEWAALDVKTARFVYTQAGEMKHQDVVFSGDVVDVPILSNVRDVYVGVYAGDLRTSTPARICCTKSILCGDPVHDDPPEDVYNQIIELLNSHPGGSGVTSWNDLTDKPFGDEIIMEEKTFTFASEDDFFSMEIPPAIVAGKTYTLVVNGIPYKTVADDHEGMGGFFQLGYPGFTEPDGCCVIVAAQYDGTMNIALDIWSGNYTFSYPVTVTVEILGEVKTLDEQYIPNIAWDKVTFDTERESIIENFTSVAGGWVDGVLIPGETYIVKVNEDTISCVAEFVRDEEYGDYCRLPLDDSPIAMADDVTIDYEYNAQKIYIGTMGGGETISVYHVVKQTIDEDVLPYKTEEWTFELADGTTVTKQVVLK